jgi:hypothetical protein
VLIPSAPIKLYSTQGLPVPLFTVSDIQLLFFVFLRAEVLDRLLGAGAAVAQFFEHGFDHAIIQLLIFLIGAVGQPRL